MIVQSSSDPGISPVNDDIRPFLVPETHTIRQAMEQLETTEEKIIFAVDGESRLVGSLTDGDIRRWILSDGDLKAPVSMVCNRNPRVAREGFSGEEIRNVMLSGNIGCIPVINGCGTITQLLFWKQLFQETVPVRVPRTLQLPVVIMAGGQGTRMAPFTNVLPKPLLPVGDRTVIEVIIDQFLRYGLNQFHLSVNYKSKIVKSFFEELSPAYSVTYLYEDEPRGTAGSLRALYMPVRDPIIVTNCDIVIQTDLTDLVAFHTDHDYDLTLVASLKEYRIPYGVCELEGGGRLARITEKPQYSFLVNTGMYVVSRDCLELIPEQGRCDMTDLIARIKQAAGRIGVFPIGETAWVDTGEWAEYRKALDTLGRLGAGGAGVIGG